MGTIHRIISPGKASGARGGLILDGSPTPLALFHGLLQYGRAVDRLGALIRAGKLTRRRSVGAYSNVT